MAEDSRDSSTLLKAGSNTQIPNDLADSQKPKYNPSQSQTGKLWDAFGNPEEPANALARATYKPRGKDPKDVPYSEIIGSFPVSEMTTLHKRPCARESLLTGIGVGFGVGGLRGVLKGISTFFRYSDTGIMGLMCACRTVLSMVCWKLGCRHVCDQFIGLI